MDPQTATGAADEAAAGTDRPTGPSPPSIRPTWIDVVCVGPIILSLVYGYASIPLGPSLITRPVLHSLLRASISAIITSGSYAAAGRVPLWQVVLAPLPLLMFADPFLYWTGRRYGRRIIDYYAGQDERWRRRMARGERFFARWGPWTIVAAYFLPAPSPLFYIAAGETRMRIWVFALADLSGTLLWVGFLIGLGWSLGDRGVSIAEAISHYGLYLTIALVAIVFAFSFRRAWRASGEAGRR